jgi:hypothetical protein
MNLKTVFPEEFHGLHKAAKMMNGKNIKNLVQKHLISEFLSPILRTHFCSASANNQY